MLRLLQKVFTSKPLLTLAGIFILALALRLIKLGSLPANFHEDEVLVGYVGRYILENGKDIYGNPWPLLYFNKFGDFYIILPMYVSGLATFIFGVNEFAVRFPAAFFGSLVVFPVYYLSVRIFNNKVIGLLTAFFIAIMPWHIVLSRSSVEGIIGSTIFITGIAVLINSIDTHRLKALFIASFLFFISYFIYHPFRIYVPLALVPCIFLFKNIRLHKKYFSTYLVITVLFFFLTAYISSTPWGKGRFVQTSIFSPLSGVEIRIQQQIYNMGPDKPVLARILHNKVIGYGREFLTQYFTYFSPVFLFALGGSQTRYDLPDHGLLYVTYLIFIIAALIPLSKKIKNDVDIPGVWYLIYLLLLAPFPAAMTYYGSPNIHRSVFLGVLLSFFVAYGCYNLFTGIKYKKLIFICVSVFFIGELIYFASQYGMQFDVYNSLNRNDGQKQVVEYIYKEKNNYKEVLIPVEGAMPLYYLFFANDFDPKYSSQFRDDAKIDKVGNVRFIDNSCPSSVIMHENQVRNTLIIDRPQCADTTMFKTIKEIFYKNSLWKYKVKVLP